MYILSVIFSLLLVLIFWKFFKVALKLLFIVIISAMIIMFFFQEAHAFGWGGKKTETKKVKINKKEYQSFLFKSFDDNIYIIDKSKIGYVKLREDGSLILLNLNNQQIDIIPFYTEEHLKDALQKLFGDFHEIKSGIEAVK